MGTIGSLCSGSPEALAAGPQDSTCGRDGSLGFTSGEWTLFPADGSQGPGATAALPVCVGGPPEILAACPTAGSCVAVLVGLARGSVICAGCCAIELGIGAIDDDAGSLVVTPGSIAVAGPKVLGGSNTLNQNALQYLKSEICLSLSGKAK